MLAAATGLTLVEPRRLRGVWRAAYWAAVSALSGLVVAESAAQERALLGDLPDGGATRCGPSAQGLAAAGLTACVRRPALAADAWVTDALTALGSRRPRARMGAATAAGGAWSLVLQPAYPRWGATAVGLEEPVVELEPGVRHVIEGMLGATDDWGAPELRAQLESARQRGTMADGSVGLVVDEAAPRSQGDHYDFPVIARGESAGRPVTVTLTVVDGAMAFLECRDDEELEPAPMPDELRVGPRTAR